MEKLLQFALTWYGILIFFIFVSLWVIHLVMRTRRITHLNAKVDQLVVALESYQSEELEREVRADEREGALVHEKMQRMGSLLKKAYYGMCDKNRIAVFEAIAEYKELLALVTARPFKGVSDDIRYHLSFTFKPYYMLDHGLDLKDYSSCPKVKWPELSMTLFETSSDKFYANLVEHLAVLVRYSLFDKHGYYGHGFVDDELLFTFSKGNAQWPGSLMQKGLTSLDDLPLSVIRGVFQRFFDGYRWDSFWWRQDGVFDDYDYMARIYMDRIAVESVLKCLWSLELGFKGLDQMLESYELLRGEVVCQFEDSDSPGFFNPPSYKEEPDSLRQYLYEELELYQRHGHWDLNSLIPPRLG
jgi:hypothetical protein